MSFEITLILMPSFVKSQTEIHENTDDNLIKPIIQDCQNMFIQPILGSDLYNEIISQIKADTLTDLNKTLINDYLVMPMLKWITAEYIRQGSYKITNKGIVTMSGDNASVASQDELMDMSQRFLNKAEWYAQRTTMYLIENEEQYPLYCNFGDGLDVIRPRTNNYRTGFALGNDRFRKKGGKDSTIDL